MDGRCHLLNVFNYGHFTNLTSFTSYRQTDNATTTVVVLGIHILYLRHSLTDFLPVTRDPLPSPCLGSGRERRTWGRVFTLIFN